MFNWFRKRSGKSSHADGTVAPPIDRSAISQVSIAERASSVADVVFVHGLDGHPMETWTGHGTDAFSWPAALAADVASVTVWTLGYPARSSAWRGGAMSLVDRAINILAVLEAEQFGDRPLVFIAHSLGGLLVKQLLHQAYESNNQVWQQVGEHTTGVVFLATPHAGSELASLLSNVPLLRPTPALHDLIANDPHLRELNRWYQTAVTSGALKVANRIFYENWATRGVTVVSPMSADPWIPYAIPVPIDADHISISKPSGESDLLYKLVKKFVIERASELVDPVPVASPPIVPRASGRASAGSSATTPLLRQSVAIVYERAPRYPLFSFSVLNTEDEPAQVTAIHCVKAAAVGDDHGGMKQLRGPRLRLDFSLRNARDGEWKRAFGDDVVANLAPGEAEAYQLNVESENILCLVDMDVDSVTRTRGSTTSFTDEIILAHGPYGAGSDHLERGLVVCVPRSTCLMALLSDDTAPLFGQEPYRNCPNVRFALLRGGAYLCRGDLRAGWSTLVERFGASDDMGIIATSFAELGTRAVLPAEIRTELVAIARDPLRLGGVPVWDEERLSVTFVDAVRRLRTA